MPFKPIVFQAIICLTLFVSFIISNQAFGFSMNNQSEQSDDPIEVRKSPKQNGVWLVLNAQVENEQANLIITNKEGIVVFKEEVEVVNGQPFKLLKHSDYNPGEYLIRIEAGEKVFQKTINL